MSKKIFTVLLCLTIVMSFVVSSYALTSVPIKSLKLDKTGVSLSVGQTYNLKVTFNPANTTQKLLIYSTSNSNVATIDAAGKITAVNPGKAVITVISSSNKQISAKCDVSVAPEKTLEISWVPQNDAPVDPNSPIIQQFEKKFNVKFNFIYMDRTQSTQLLNMRIASGDIPDVMQISDPQMRTFADQGVLAEIPESLLKSSAPGLYDLVLKNAGSDAWEYGKVNGKLFGIPALSPDGVYQFVPMWRTDWLTNVGISKMPETLVDAEDAFRKFVKNDPDKNGKNDTYALSDKGISAIFGAYGAIPYTSKGGGDKFTWTVRNGKVVASATLPEMQQALLVLTKWYKEGLIDPEFISGENKGQYWGSAVSFWNGVIGFTCAGQYYHVNKPLSETDPGSINYQNFIKLQPNGVYDYGKPLSSKKSMGVTEKWGTITGADIVFGKRVDAVKMKKILEIHNTMSTDFDSFVLSRFGQKDVNYQIMPNGDYTWTGDYTQAASQGKLGLHLDGIGWAEVDNFDFYKKVTPNKYALADKIGNYDTGFTNVVWAGLPSDPQYHDAVQTKIKQNYAMFITGARNINEFDKFVEELNTAGLSQLTTEANSWYKSFHK